MPTEKSEYIETKEKGEVDESAYTKSNMKTSISMEHKDAEKPLSSQTKDKDQNVSKQTAVISSSGHSDRSTKKSIPRGRSRRTSRQSIENGESGDEACCIRFGGMIRNKAFDLIPQAKLLASPKQKSETEIKPKARRHRGSHQDVYSGHSVGDDLSIDGCHGVRFVDDDETESSTDYRDIDENSVFLLELACHSDAQTISRGESCMDYSESGYYTSDVTTKDDDLLFIPKEAVSSDNEKSKKSEVLKKIEIEEEEDFETLTSESSETKLPPPVSKQLEIEKELEKQKPDMCKESKFQPDGSENILIEDKSKDKKPLIQTKKRVKSPPRPPPSKKSEEIVQAAISKEESTCENELIKSSENEQSIISKEKVNDSVQNETILISKELDIKPKKRVTSPPRPPPPKFTEAVTTEQINTAETETKPDYINPFETEAESEVINDIENYVKSEHVKAVENETKSEQVKNIENQTKPQQVTTVENEASSKKKEIFPTKKMYTFPRKYPPPIPVKPFRNKEEKENITEINKDSETSKESTKLPSLSPKTFPRSGKRGPRPISPLKKIETETLQSNEKPILTTVVKNSYLEGLQPLPSQKSPTLKRTVPSRPPRPHFQTNKVTNVESKTGFESNQKCENEGKDEFRSDDNDKKTDEDTSVEQNLASKMDQKTPESSNNIENSETAVTDSKSVDQSGENQFSTWPIAAERKKRKMKSPPRLPLTQEPENIEIQNLDASDLPIVPPESKLNKNVYEISSLDSRGRKRVKSPPRPPLPHNRFYKNGKLTETNDNEGLEKIKKNHSITLPPTLLASNDEKTTFVEHKEKIDNNEKRLISPPRPPPPIHETLPKKKTDVEIVSSFDKSEIISASLTEDKKRVTSPPRPPPPIYQKISPRKDAKPISEKVNQESLDKKIPEQKIEDSISSISNNSTENKQVTSPPRPPPPIYEKLFPKKVESFSDISENKTLEQNNQLSQEQSVPLSPTSSIAMHEYEEIKTPSIFDEHSSINFSTLPPKAPPRVRRNRSRTVEIVSLTEKPERRKQRSHSLSESDVCKKMEDRGMLSTSQLAEMKTLYTVVQKERGKMTLQEPDTNEDGRITPNYDKMKFRPLPPPPPPPRSRSRLSTYSPASIRRTSLSEELKSEPTQQDTNISLTKEIIGDDDDKLVNCDEIANISTSSYYTVTEQESDKNDENDISENVTTIQSNEESKSVFYSDKSKTKTERRKSQSPVRSKSSSPTKQRSATSSWYDESDVSGDLGDVDTSVSSQKESMEGINNCEENRDINNSPISKPKQGKLKTDSSKKGNRSSKFYCDVEVNTTEEPLNVELAETERPVSTSSFVEKSIQTSPEREISSIKDDQSDDTDDLLDRARTVQMELCLMLERRKRKKGHSTDDTKSSCSYSPSPKIVSRHKIKTPDDISSDHSHLSPQPQSSVEFRLPISSTRSSNSELSWQGSSSEESEDEKVGHSPNFLHTKKQKKAFYIAREIMTSEEVFVSCLKLLNEDYRGSIKKANEERGGTIISEETLSFFLRYFPQLQNLNENLLADLKDRIEHWEEKGKIADVIVKIGPFLKLYSSYIRDFDSLEAAFDDARRKYPLFDQITKEFELSSRCKKLALKHYMLKPIQRIPQYRLLLQEYLHNLSEESPDYADTVSALQIVSEVANHANETLRLGDNFQKLVSIQNSILGSYEIVRPGRIFLREGELMKLSRKEMQPRWFILFNDSLFYLICMQQGLYKVNYELPLTGMKVSIPQNQDYKNEFSIISVTRSFTLAARSLEERQEWVDTLNKAIEENASKRSTFTTAMLQKDKEDQVENTFVLGKQAPVWIPDARVTMCQLCTSEFTVTFRRHHCRACGKVVCSLCSGNKAPLQYRNFQVAKVCDECFQVLQKEFEATEPAEKTSEIGESGTGSEVGETDSDSSHALASIKAQFKGNVKSVGKKIKRHLPSVLKEVCANDQGSTISGYLRKRDRKNWKNFWFVLKDKVLYKYKASEDIAALESIPLLGFEVEMFTQPFENIEAELLFQLTHAGQLPMIFYADSPISAERWVQAMQKATILE